MSYLLKHWGFCIGALGCTLIFTISIYLPIGQTIHAVGPATDTAGIAIHRLQTSTRFDELNQTDDEQAPPFDKLKWSDHAVVVAPQTAHNAKLRATDQGAGDELGHTVAIKEDLAVAGAPYDDDKALDAGAVYLFQQTTGNSNDWQQIKKLVASDGHTEAKFGWVVALDGDILAVSAPYDDMQSERAGAVYIFARNEGGADNWGQVKKVVAQETRAGDYFGWALSLSGDLLVVGAEGADEGAFNTGAVYLFSRNQGGTDNWGQVKKIVAADIASGDAFGIAVAARGNVVSVGALGQESGNQINAGAVYIFSRDQGGTNNWGQVKKLFASDAAANDFFGTAVALDGDTLLVGAPGNDDGGVNSGSAYIFERNYPTPNSWGERKKLVAASAAGNDSFGDTVAVAGDSVMVGAPYQDGVTGAAYVFKRNQDGPNNWGQVKHLVPTDGATSGHFGAAIAIYIELVVIGAPYNATNGLSAGMAYLMDRNTGGAENWGGITNLAAHDVAVGDHLGNAVALSGDTALIGAPSDSDAAMQAGAAYIFVRDKNGQWQQLRKLIAPDAHFDDFFGEAVAMNGDTAVVATEPIENFGAAYVFERHQGGLNQWGLVKKLTVAPAIGDIYDTTVVMENDTIVFVSIIEDLDAHFFVRAIVFERNAGGSNNWGQTAALTSTDTDSSNRFSPAAAISGDTIVVGAARNNDGGNVSGSAYIFERKQDGPNQWGQIKRIAPVLAADNSGFGKAVAISGDLVAVGAPADANSTGAVYLFMRNLGGANNWGQVKKVTATDGANNDQFGAIVTMDGDALLVGADWDDTVGQDDGSAYLFARNQGGSNQWGFVVKLTASDAATNDHFGRALDINGTQIIVGAPGNEQTGSAYLYSSDPALSCYLLTRTHSGAGSDPATLPTRSSSCPQNQYTSGESIQLTAAPDLGWSIGGWSGTENNNSTASNNLLVMPTNQHTVQVVYIPICYHLTLSHNGVGGDPVATPTASTGCNTGSYHYGEIITLTAGPATGYQVDSWSGTNNDVSNALQNSLTMPASERTIGVTYSQACYALILTHSGEGSDPIATPVQSVGCALQTYHYGESLNLTAMPNQGWQLAHWSGTADDNRVTSNNTLIMPAGAHQVAVLYAHTCYQLTLTHSGEGGDPTATPGQSTGCAVGRYHFNEPINLTAATPTSGWQIASWSGTANNASTAASNSLTMPASDHTASVQYSLLPVAGEGDLYELDNLCTRSRLIATDGSEAQAHTFHAANDLDWVRFNAAANVSYRIEVRVPATSTADVNLEVYGGCEGSVLDQWNASFSPEVRLDFKAAASGPIYLRLANQPADVAGNQVQYTITVRTLEQASTNRALILVAGRLKGTDSLQQNIHNVTNAVYKLFQRNGYDDEHIQYLATDATLPGYDGALNSDALRVAITEWAKNKLSADGVLTLYLMDHGSPDIFYLDETQGQRLTPTDLNAWLNTVEQAVPNLKVNVIIEACQSGSFITPPQSISKAGRVILTSTSTENDAKASKDGAYFSDHLVTWLHQGYNLFASFSEAQAVAQSIFALQKAQLDADGNGVPNEFSDGALAAKRSFAYAGSLPGDDWPPHIFSVQGPSAIVNASGVIQADVRDNLQVRQVWAVIYPPDYSPPPTGQQLQPEVLPTILFTLTDASNQLYAGKYTGFTQTGVYRLVVHAEDADGLVARPVVIEVNVTSGQVFLPVVAR